MTESERDLLIEKSLLKELNETEEAQVQQLRLDDAAFRQEYDFQQMLKQQVQLKRQQELLDMFAGFEEEYDNQDDIDDTDDDTAKVLPLHKEKEVRWLWQKRLLRVVAVAALISLISFVIWQISRIERGPIAHGQDSTKTDAPKDTIRKKPNSLPPIPVPNGPITEKKTKPAQLHGPVKIPFYETNNEEFGFGESQQTTQYRTVVFEVGAQPAYQFEDTLKVYLPVLPPVKPAWKLVYNRNTDTYYLQAGKKSYEVIQGLQGKQSLVKRKEQ